MNWHFPAEITKSQNRCITEKFRLISRNIQPSNGDIADGPKWRYNKSTKMAAAAILENTQKGVSRPILDRFAQNLVFWYRYGQYMGHRGPKYTKVRISANFFSISTKFDVQVDMAYTRVTEVQNYTFFGNSAAAILADSNTDHQLLDETQKSGWQKDKDSTAFRLSLSKNSWKRKQ